MPLYKITGARADDASDVVVIIGGKSEAHAVAAASERGIFAATIEALSERRSRVTRGTLTEVAYELLGVGRVEDALVARRAAMRLAEEAVEVTAWDRLAMVDFLIAAGYTDEAWRIIQTAKLTPPPDDERSAETWIADLYHRSAAVYRAMGRDREANAASIVRLVTLTAASWWRTNPESSAESMASELQDKLGFNRRRSEQLAASTYAALARRAYDARAAYEVEDLILEALRAGP